MIITGICGLLNLTIYKKKYCIALLEVRTLTGLSCPQTAYAESHPWAAHTPQKTFRKIPSISQTDAASPEVKKKRTRKERRNIFTCNATLAQIHHNQNAYSCKHTHKHTNAHTGEVQCVCIVREHKQPTRCICTISQRKCDSANTSLANTYIHTYNCN